MRCWLTPRLICTRGLGEHAGGGIRAQNHSTEREGKEEREEKGQDGEGDRTEGEGGREKKGKGRGRKIRGWSNYRRQDHSVEKDQGSEGGTGERTR